MLSLFIAFGLGACSVNNDDYNVDCGTYADLAFTGFPLPCNYSLKTPPSAATAVYVTNQDKMDATFTKHDNTCANPTDAAIDFSKNSLIGIFAGPKETNGYAIKITSLVENKCQIVVNFYEKSPLPGETISQTRTYPADYILIPKTLKGIVFNRTTETSDNIVIGSYGTANSFFQLNDFNTLKYLNVVTGSYNFDQYKYDAKTKRDEYNAFLKKVPTEILNLKGQTKTYGTPNSANQGGIYFELRQGATVTKVYIDVTDTADQNTEVILFKKAIQDKINSLK